MYSLASYSKLLENDAFLPSAHASEWFYTEMLSIQKYDLWHLRCQDVNTGHFNRPWFVVYYCRSISMPRKFYSHAKE